MPRELFSRILLGIGRRKVGCRVNFFFVFQLINTLQIEIKNYSSN